MLTYFPNLKTLTKICLTAYLFDGNLEVCCLVVEFSSDVNVSGPCAHGTSCDQASFNQLVGVVTHNLSERAEDVQSTLGFETLDKAAALGLETTTPLTGPRQYINSNLGFSNLKI